MFADCVFLPAVQTGFLLCTVAGALLCRQNISAFIGGCFPFAYADVYLFGLHTFISCILLFAVPGRYFAATRAYRRFTLVAELPCTCRRPFFLSKCGGSFRGYVRLLHFWQNSPCCCLRLLSSFLFVKFCCTNLRLFFRQTRRSFLRFCSLIAFFGKTVPCCCLR